MERRKAAMGILMLLGGVTIARVNGPTAPVGDGKADDTARDSESGGFRQRERSACRKALTASRSRSSSSWTRSVTRRSAARRWRRSSWPGRGRRCGSSARTQKSADPAGFAQDVWDRQRMPLVDALAIDGDHPEAVGIEADRHHGTDPDPASHPGQLLHVHSPRRQQPQRAHRGLPPLRESRASASSTTTSTCTSRTSPAATSATIAAAASSSRGGQRPQHPHHRLRHREQHGPRDAARRPTS